MRKIIEVQIVGPNTEVGVYQAKIVATFDDKLEKTIINYYNDEIQFKSSELIGLTEEEARTLHFKKDKHYLQS